MARIGLADDFFDLGGHSLLAVQVTAAVRESLGRALPVRALFEAPCWATTPRRCAAPRPPRPRRPRRSRCARPYRPTPPASTTCPPRSWRS
ncbi:phosphopantetheine-binding protein [Kitasatospora aburaviensis]